MRRIDDLHLEYPFAGSRMLKGLLQAEGHQLGRLHVSTLMKKMAISALYRRPNMSKTAPGHKIYPSLLRNVLRPARDLQQRQSEDDCQFSGGMTQTAIDRGRLAPQGASVWLGSNTDRPGCLSLDLSAARERLAVRHSLGPCL